MELHNGALGSGTLALGKVWVFCLRRITVLMCSLRELAVYVRSDRRLSTSFTRGGKESHARRLLTSCTRGGKESHARIRLNLLSVPMSVLCKFVWRMDCPALQIKSQHQRYTFDLERSSQSRLRLRTSAGCSYPRCATATKRPSTHSTSFVPSLRRSVATL